MSKHGKLNLLGMLLLPVAVTLAAWIATMNGVWNAYSNTYIFLFSINAVVTVLGAIFSGIFLRNSVGDKARLIAILPTLVPSIYGSVWYLWRGLFPSEVAPGAEYIGVVQYLLIIMVLMTFLVAVARMTGLAPRQS
ncbi:MAG: hypothetical protein ACR2QG_06160 [Gammaproteobacteria bacterium]